MTELEKILMKAIADVMYDTNHCPVCKKHYAHHAEGCAWVTAQQSEQRVTTPDELSSMQSELDAYKRACGGKTPQEMTEYLEEILVTYRIANSILEGIAGDGDKRIAHR